MTPSTQHRTQPAEPALDDNITQVATEGEPRPVVLGTFHDVRLVVASLERRVLELSKIAKKTREQGYSTEARAIEADAETITEELLSQFSKQTALDLDDSENGREAVRAVIAECVRSYSELELADAITRRMYGVLLDVARRGFNAGMAARAMTPDALVSRSLVSLSEFAD